MKRRSPLRCQLSALGAAGWTRFAGEGAFSLLELIGALAVVAILATAILTVAFKHLDRLASDQEYAQLRSYAQAFQNSVQRYRYIPGATGASNWVSMIAAESAADQASVAVNPRGRPRLLLVDPALQVGTTGSRLPYWQAPSGSVVTNTSGALIPPVNPRVLILSSLGPALPAAVTNWPNGLPPSTNDFNAIWNAAEGTLPSSPAWTGWTGSGEALKIQRINFSSLFVNLLLDNIYSKGVNDTPSYAIDHSTPWPVTTNDVTGYFIKSSVLSLYGGTNLNSCGVNTNLDSESVLADDTHYVYTLGVWRGELYRGNPITAPLMAVAVAQFLAAPGNPHAGNVDMTYYPGYPKNNPPSIKSTPQWVVNVYALYMRLYNSWAAAGFPVGAAYDPIYLKPLQSTRAAMKQMADALDNGIQQGQCTPP